MIEVTSVTNAIDQTAAFSLHSTPLHSTPLHSTPLPSPPRPTPLQKINKKRASTTTVTVLRRTCRGPSPICCVSHLQASQGRSQVLVKAMDDYGLGVAATLNDSSNNSMVVDTMNLAMRINRVDKDMKDMRV